MFHIFSVIGTQLVDLDVLDLFTDRQKLLGIAFVSYEQYKCYCQSVGDILSPVFLFVCFFY